MSPAPAAPESTTPADRFARWRRFTRPVLVANLVAQIGIIVTGGAVRLTGSGLGCSTWPQCEPGHFTPQFHEATSIHPYVEFGNRTLTGVLAVIALAVALLVFTDRTRAASYRRLGLAPLVLVAVQAVVGGVTVRLDLDPAVVGVHFLISAGLVALSTVLLYRHGEGDGAPVAAVGRLDERLVRVLTALVVPVVALGVLVTGSGPHGGDDEVAYRFALDPARMTQAHAASVWVFVLVLIVIAVRAWRHGAPPRVRRAIVVLAVVTLAQGAIGYVQYFTGLPELLVGLHMLGAGLLVAATTWLLMTTRVRA